ncbi:tetratricopeptide repeat-containing sensor histidine kinase [Flavobacterium silvaticum]|uniref:Tetratricopeptide repeat protein n=1 Tax=Flavobacterium silvaticum TaxID=1852020 RepID=A0A972JI59_9FLAO|nr:histidine kinase [Flavobacterium silvaticum]NMH27838.1 tetratricopeptide repeat protein [Flavobacterium silvaticum]
MQKYLLFLSCVLLLSCSKKQDKKTVDATVEKDSLSVIALLQSAEDSSETNPSDSKQNLLRAGQIVSKYKNPYLEGCVLDSHSVVAFYQNELDQAIAFELKAVDVYLKNGYSLEASGSLGRIGLFYQYRNEYDKSLEALYRAMKLAEKEKYNSKALIRIYSNLGNAYDELNDYDKALEYAFKVLALLKEQKDPEGYGHAFNNIGAIYISKKEFPKALAFFEKASVYTDSINRPEFFCQVNFNQGLCYYNLKKFDKALFYIYRAEKYRDKSGVTLNGCKDLMLMASVYEELNRNDSVKKYLDLSQKCDTVVNDYNFRSEHYKLQSKFLSAKNNYRGALALLEKSHQFSDSSLLRNKDIDIQRNYIKYQYEKKSEADSLKYRLQLIESDTKSSRNRNNFIVSLLILTLVVAAAIILRNRNHLLKKQKDLEAKDRQLAEQQALRAKMSPHFIFNCLNTIDAYVMQDKQEEASRLIQDFSKLSRKVLDFSDVESVDLSEEIAFLNIYLNIEKIRLNDSFTFEISADESILDYQIPPMIIQPFVENAVIHGIRNRRDEKGIIKVSFFFKEDKLHAVIEDNGVGRDKAKALQQHKEHVSKAIAIVRQRLSGRNGKTAAENLITFTDKPNGSGTIVEVVIPKSTATESIK